MKTNYGHDVPSDYKYPDWENAGRVHEWMNYIQPEVRKLWNSFTDEQKAALAYNADILASLEEWDRI